MDSERLHRIQTLFLEVADLPASEQRTYLAAACGADEALRSEVVAMLEADAGQASLLERGLPDIAHALLDDSNSLPAPDELGPYKITRLLGEGMTGVVFLADREDIGGQVAIKVLRDGSFSPDRRKRFALEQRMLTRLIHPSIARIYDARTSSNGTPWFAMEYVDGLPLTEYCLKRECSIDARLQLFRSICGAVQYAHKHAIIHRDLKPSNILVTGDGTVKLLDFGIAKQMEDGADPEDRRTLTGLRPMTLAYASPEQIRGERPGTQTDVYSLGVILYELLTGALPFDLSSGSLGEAERTILQQEPQPPSAAARDRSKNPEAHRNVQRIGKGAWSELDVLCLTALHKDVQRRYPSLEALIRDIDHYLKGEPLEARPDSLGYRTGKFVRRNRRSLAGAAAAFALIVALGVFFVVRLTKAHNAILAEATRTKRIEQFMLILFDGGDKTAGPADDLRVVALLDRGVKSAEALKTEPAVQAELYTTLGNIYRKLGRLDRADQMLNAALERRKSIAGPDSAEVADGLIALGLLRLDQSKVADAERLVREGLALHRKHLPPRDPSVTRATFALGRVIEERGDYGEATKILDETAKLQSVQGPPTTDLSDTMNALLIATIDAGNFAIADTLGRRALATDRQIYGEIHPRVADDLANLGVVQYDLRQFAEAERYYRQALSIKQSWYGREHPDTAICMVGVGQALLAQHHFDEAADMLHEAIAIQERIYGEVHPQIAIGLNMLGSLELQRGNLNDAEADFRRMADINRSVYGDKHFLVGVALASLGRVNLKKKQPVDAERYFDDALQDFTATIAPGHPYIGIAQVGLGSSLVLQRRYKEAEGHLLTGYGILTKQPSPSAKDIADARNNLVVVYDALHQPDQAARFRAELANAAQTGAPPPSKTAAR
jgi:serine/threonine protein kinase/Tfp pilus assembly protein PilF